MKSGSRVATERLFDADETRGAFATAIAPSNRIAKVDIAALENTARGVAYTPARVRRSLAGTIYSDPR